VGEGESPRNQKKKKAVKRIGKKKTKKRKRRDMGTLSILLQGFKEEISSKSAHKFSSCIYERTAPKT